MVWFIVLCCFSPNNIYNYFKKNWIEVDLTSFLSPLSVKTILNKELNGILSCCFSLCKLNLIFLIIATQLLSNYLMMVFGTII